MHIAHAHRVRGPRWADDEAAWESMRRKVPHSVGEAFAVIESFNMNGQWVFGDACTVSDFYLLTLARWLEADGVDLSQLPRVLAHRQRMLDLPLVRRVIEREGA